VGGLVWGDGERNGPQPVLPAELVQGAQMGRDLASLAGRPRCLQSKRLLIESRWVSKPLAFADKLDHGDSTNRRFDSPGRWCPP
jgi:hypothetical protein